MTRDYSKNKVTSPTTSAGQVKKKKPVEWQADQFAAYLLMPRGLVRPAWEAWRGDFDSLTLPDLRALVGSGGTDEIVMENAIRSFADKFQVSREAMRIWLEELGLLVRTKISALF